MLRGDTNCNVLLSSTVSKLINDNMNKIDLIVCNSLLRTVPNIEYTFVAESRGAYSIIDHFFLTNTNSNFVHSLNVIHDVDNLSDHLPLLLALDKSIIIHCKNIAAIDSNIATATDQPSARSNECNFRLDWDKRLLITVRRLELKY